jgi:hypothetical protein
MDLDDVDDDSPLLPTSKAGFEKEIDVQDGLGDRKHPPKAAAVLY